MYASIPSPLKPMSDVDAQIDCESAIDIEVRRLIEDIIRAGWSPEVTFAAMRDVVANQAFAYFKDPDPADEAPEGRDPVSASLAPF